MKKQITEHFNVLYKDKLEAQGGRGSAKKRISSFSLENEDPDMILTKAAEIAKSWSEEKKIKLIKKMIEIEGEATDLQPIDEEKPGQSTSQEASKKEKTLA